MRKKILLPLFLFLASLLIIFSSVSCSGGGGGSSGGGGGGGSTASSQSPATNPGSAAPETPTSPTQLPTTKEGNTIECFVFTPNPAGKSYSLSAPTGYAAVSNARVSILGKDKYSLTDGNGYAKIENISAGSYTITIGKNGLEVLTYSNISVSDTANTIVGSQTTGVDIRASTKPGILDLSSTTGDAGSTITISGSNFGADQGSSCVTFNGIDAQVTSWSANQIICVITGGTSTGNVSVTVGSETSNSFPFSIGNSGEAPAPQITTLSPSGGIAGTDVTISGKNFGITQGSSKVAFGGVETTSVTSWSNKKIACKTPAGAATGNVIVTVNGKESNGASFTVYPIPKISSVNPSYISPNHFVAINGKNFGDAKGSSAVSFNGAEASSINSWRDGQIVCKPPQGVSEGNVVVMVNGINSNGAAYTVNAAGASYDSATSYTLNDFTSGAQGVLVITNLTANDLYFYCTASSYSISAKQRELRDIFSLSTKNLINLNQRGALKGPKKDLDPSIIKYAEQMNKTYGVRKKDLKTFKTYHEGDQELFYIFQNGETLTTCTAQCYKASANCYVFIDIASEDIPSGARTSTANNIATSFDSDNSPFMAGNGIYGQTRRYFGSEWKPGIDGDNKIYLLISPKLGDEGLYGYFYSADETTAAGSNQKEIIYINDCLFSNNMYDGLSTIAHEFQHMVNYNMKYKEGGGKTETLSINEGKSMLNEQLNGFTISGGAGYSGNGFMFSAVKTFLSYPYYFWFKLWYGDNVDYGGSYLFMLYVWERYGDDILENIAQSANVGPDNIASCAGESFSTLYKDWALVNYYTGLNGNPVLPSENAHAKYSSINTKGTYTVYSAMDNNTTQSRTLTGIAFQDSVLFYPQNDSPEVYSYSCRYHSFAPQSAEMNILSVLCQNNAANPLYYNFVSENPSGTFSNMQ